MGFIERWRMSRPAWQAFHGEALIGVRDQAARSLARANSAIAERDEVREQLRGAVGALREIAAINDRVPGVIAANALHDLGIGDPLVERFGEQ